jgi:endonuclease/exonuclease/phosphatase family metal-dependent hydrolase
MSQVLPFTLSEPADPLDARLRGWRENVGEALAHDFAPLKGDESSTGENVIVVLSWNVWVGRGRLTELIGRFRDGDFARLGAPAGAPLLVLVQEAYRSDDSIPLQASGWTPRGSSRHFRPEEDIVNVARMLRLNVRYAPSMRNGTHRSDRGNAILSTQPLVEAHAFELPFVVQRRVAVGATLALGDAGPASFRLRTYSAHLDPFGAQRSDWLGIAGRAVQAKGLLQRMSNGSGPPQDLPRILGADLNIARGRREPAYRALVDAGFRTGIPPREPNWGHTYHMVPRLPIDYLLFCSSGNAISRATVHRLNENPRDAGPYVFGSDHHPLIARVELEREEEPQRKTLS